MKNKVWRKVLRYFVQGLIVIAPFAITIYIIVALFLWLDNVVPRLFQITLYPGVGIVIVVSFILTLGYIASNFLTKSLITIFESSIKRIPLVNLLYSSTKDVMDAFVGEKRKFDHPVLVKVDAQLNFYRIGFITREDLNDLGLLEHTAVYFPHSYNISGNLFMVPTKDIQHLKISSSEAMKFVVSGGVAGLHA
ncbi:MAG: hypothetical protein JWO58_2784 [Chitinophagaceae bacterium]|nr:hypothetical protein [Chitinophagaceae bacterium]